MSAISLMSTPSSTGRKRPLAARSGGRLAAYALAAAAHVGLLAAVSLQAVKAPEGGAAPVVNLTLEPSPRFDSETPPAAASTADSRAPSEAKAQPRPVVSPLRLRETTSTLASELSLPLTIRLTEPTPRLPERREAGEQPGATRAVEGAGSGAASADASVAGATQGGGGATLGAAAAPDTDVYFARVLAWIEQNKRHPGSAKGIVTVSFRLDRRGRVSGLRLVRSSGVRALDRSAMDQMIAAQPFPRPEAGVEWSSRQFTVNIDYRSRRDA